MAQNEINEDSNEKIIRLMNLVLDNINDVPKNPVEQIVVYVSKEELNDFIGEHYCEIDHIESYNNKTMYMVFINKPLNESF